MLYYKTVNYPRLNMSFIITMASRMLSINQEYIFKAGSTIDTPAQNTGTATDGNYSIFLCYFIEKVNYKHFNLTI